MNPIFSYTQKRGDAPDEGCKKAHLEPHRRAIEANLKPITPVEFALVNTVESLDVKRVKIYERPFSLSHDLELLEDAIKSMKAVLVIFDPLMAVLGHNINSSSDQSVREVFTPLAQLAERTGCAVLIIRHLTGAMQEILFIVVLALSVSLPRPV
ncbi:MAG: AAA family ATPase [Ktedonobacteraceae bacterium]